MKKERVCFLLSSNLKANVWFRMKPFGLKSVKVCAPKSSVRLEGQPCSLGHSRRKVKLMDERSYTLSIGNGDYFWTNKDTLWNYVQTLSGKMSAVMKNECFKTFKKLIIQIIPTSCRKLETWREIRRKIKIVMPLNFFFKFYLDVKECR